MVVPHQHAFADAVHRTGKDEHMEGIEIAKGYELKRETKSRRVQLLMRPYTHERMKQLAEEDGISFNELMNRVCDAYVNDNE